MHILRDWCLSGFWTNTEIQSLQWAYNVWTEELNKGQVFGLFSKKQNNKKTSNAPRPRDRLMAFEQWSISYPVTGIMEAEAQLEMPSHAQSIGYDPQIDR